MSGASKKALVLGVGLQGKAVIHDLERSPLVEEVIAADLHVEGAKAFASRVGLKKVTFIAADASSETELERLIVESGAHIVVCMLPAAFGYSIARAALSAGIPFVSSSYAGKVADLDSEALQKGVTILPEMGMDPGIDLLLARMVISELDEVHGLYSYGAGLPEPCCADNPIKYKITWTFDGVLKAYKRPARLLKDGVEIQVAGTEIFREENIHLLDVPGLGQLEAYPNGDAIHYIDVFGLNDTIKTMGRFGMRYAGHCQFWRTLVDLGFLDDKPTQMEGAGISPHAFLVNHLTPRLQFQPQERDIAIIRVSGWGLKSGKQRNVTLDIIDYRDLESGLFAMNRTVGYTTSIGAQMILDGTISGAGVLSPVRDVPAERVLEQLTARGMRLDRYITE